jgi:hypothetical protein
MSRTYRWDFYRQEYIGEAFLKGPIGTPRWWRRMFMVQPLRRANKDHIHRVCRGDDPEGISWPMGSRKPHHYYW